MYHKLTASRSPNPGFPAQSVPELQYRQEPTLAQLERAVELDLKHGRSQNLFRRHDLCIGKLACLSVRGWQVIWPLASMYSQMQHVYAVPNLNKVHLQEAFVVNVQALEHNSRTALLGKELTCPPSGTTAGSIAKCAVSAAAKRNAVCATDAEIIRWARLQPSSSCRWQHRQLQCRYEDSPVSTCTPCAPGRFAISQTINELMSTPVTYTCNL